MSGSLSSNELDLILRTYGCRYMGAIDCPDEILHKSSKIRERLIQKNINVYNNSSPHITHLEIWPITLIVSDIRVHVMSRRRLYPFHTHLGHCLQDSVKVFVHRPTGSLESFLCIYVPSSLSTYIEKNYNLFINLYIVTTFKAISTG